LLRDQGCLATAILGERGVEVETLRRRVEETAGPGQGEARAGDDLLAGLELPMTKPVTLVFGLAAREARELEQDRVGTEHLLLGLAREGDGVAARVLEDLGAGLLQLREAVISVYSAGADPEPPPPDRGPPPWEPPAGARLERVLPLVSEHPLPSGDLLVLLSLEIWSDWFDLRYAIVYATLEPEGELPRPAVLGRCEVSDRAGTDYVNWVTTSPAFGMVRVKQHTFVPAPPPGTEVLELRFSPPLAPLGDAPPLVVSTVVL
ncbi:MAG TPA: Clp protease N-terminal domain-containing protein, partial [Propionibacteriaceae bacterium]|nr:Clp protease N-terminal domain-containing protein [Propionibacteriaceae bacterium]